MNSRELLMTLRRIARSVNLENKRVQKEFGLSMPQVLALQFFAEQPGFQSTATRLKEHLNLNASTVTGIVQRLEKKGLIAKLPKLNDRRVTYIVLTAEGQELVNKVAPPLQERLEERLAKISRDERVQLFDSMEVLIRIMGLDDSADQDVFSDQEGLQD
ncbi:MAG: MarR family transcriptional regulator [Bacteroidota bacterium]|nr:MarR family transcriptional regulator [Bacteroidota bacterium]